MYRIRPYFYGPRLHINKNVNSYRNLQFIKKSPRGVRFKAECSIVEEVPKIEESSTVCELSDDSRIFKDRIKELNAANALIWPRIERHPRTYSIADFRHKWEGLIAGENAKELESVCVRGTFQLCKYLLHSDYERKINRFSDYGSSTIVSGHSTRW